MLINKNKESLCRELKIGHKVKIFNKFLINIYQKLFCKMEKEIFKYKFKKNPKYIKMDNNH